MLEMLEGRRLQSASLDASNTLHVTGTSGDDQIVITAVEAGLPQLHVTVNGKLEGVFIAPAVNRIVIDGLAGNDEITGCDRAEEINGGAGHDTIRANGGNDVVRGNGGCDRIDGGDGDDSICGGRGADDLCGGAGTDRLDGGRGLDVLEETERPEFVQVPLPGVWRDPFWSEILVSDRGER